MELGDTVSWAENDIKHQPVAMAYEIKVTNRVQGLHKIAMCSSTIIDHRIAHGLHGDGNGNPVYCLLQTGARLELLVASSEALDRAWPIRKVVCRFRHFKSFIMFTN